MAWLSTAPEKDAKDKSEPKSRMKVMRERDEPVSFPPNPAPHLTDWWLEIGPAGDGGIGWQDMTAWERLTGIELEPWEARTIRQMSIAYCNQRHDARKADCAAPYSVDAPEVVQERVSGQFAAMFRVLQARG